MRNLLNPRWLLVVNTLPVIILFWLMSGDYQVIKSLLGESAPEYWQLFGYSLAGLTLANLIYTAILIWKKRDVQVVYAIIALVVHIVWMYFYADNMDRLIPTSVPAWMLSGQSYIYPFTFLMPTLIYFLVVLVVLLTSYPHKRKAWISFLIMIAIPASVYLFMAFLYPILGGRNARMGYTLMVLAIVCTVAFLFFLCQCIYIIASKKAGAWKRYEILWKIPIAIFFPIMGLAVNNGTFLDSFSNSGGGFFGDFNSVWFYLLAVLNGIYVCLPPSKNPLSRSIIFYARCSTLPYTLYFFFVFLPFLPLSIAAILVFGAGFLMLTPLVLFMIHASALADDYRFLRRYHTARKLLSYSLIVFLIIPVAVSLSFLHDRKILNETLEYVYKPDYSKEYSLNKKAVLRMMDAVNAQKSNRDWNFRPGYMPYLSTYYNWLVLDNLTLSDEKVNNIRYIFSGELPRYLDTMAHLEEAVTGNHGVKITDAVTTTRYDHLKKAFVSTVDLEITNQNQRSSQEYATAFELPDGCWISDYYLYVGDRKEPGILAEKKSAMWIYSQIFNENRDPGLLHYQDGNRIVFRVFPFTSGEVRRTGIEFLHKEPFTLKLDSLVLQLDNNEQTSGEYPEVITVMDGAVIYVPASVKEALPEIIRDSYFHFILDASVHAPESADTYIAQVKAFLRDYPEFAQDARITVAGTYAETFSVTGKWQSAYRKQEKITQGFYADRAIKTALMDASDSAKRPLILILTEEIRSGVLEPNYSDFRFLYPDIEKIYTVNSEGRMLPHSLMRNTAVALSDSVNIFEFNSARVYTAPDGKGYYLRNDNNPDIIVNRPVYELPVTGKTDKDWNTALAMQGQWLTQLMHPETTDKGWLNLLQSSFRSHIMTPVTSFIVVENEAQRAALERKQKHVMDGNKSLDTEDEIMRMTEPGFWILLVLMAGVMLVFRKRIQTNRE